MKARHIYYGFAALVLSGMPVLAWASYQFSEDNSVMPSFGDWLLSPAGLFAISACVSVFATGFLISQLGSMRAVRIAGLVAMPLGMLALMFPVNWAMRLAMKNGLLESPPSPIVFWACLLTYPVFAGVLCGLVALATRATRSSIGEGADS